MFSVSSSQSLVEKQISLVVTSTQSLVTSLVYRSTNRQPSILGTTSLEISTPNIIIQVTSVLRSNSTNTTYQYGGNSSSISLPVSTLNTTDEDLYTFPITVYWARFSSVAKLFSLYDSLQDTKPKYNPNVINSDLVSLAIVDRDPEEFESLDKPAVLTFALKDIYLSAGRRPVCVFMNVSAVSVSDRWSSKGCKVAKSNLTHVVCHCSHLTNFAVLMDVYNNQARVDAAHDVILTYISYIGGTLSIIACSITIGVFQYFRIANDRVRIHQQLGMSIILVQVFFICVVNTGAKSSTPVWACRTITILMHYSLTAMFCWMLVEGIHLYVVLVRVFKLGSHIKKYSAVGWGVPLITVGLSLVAFYDRYGTGDLCWLDHDLLLVCFVPSVGLVLMINSVVLVVVIRVMLKSSGSNSKITPVERSHASIGIKATVVLLPLLGLTWVLAFLEVESDDARVLQHVFTYLFTITNSFQGVLFFVFHCLFNLDVHNAYERYRRRRRSLSNMETSSRRQDGSPNRRDLSRSTSRQTNNTTRSTLTQLSLLDQRSPEQTPEKLPILSLDKTGSTPMITGFWSRLQFNPVQELSPVTSQTVSRTLSLDGVSRGSERRLGYDVTPHGRRYTHSSDVGSRRSDVTPHGGRYTHSSDVGSRGSDVRSHKTSVRFT